MAWLRKKGLDTIDYTLLAKRGLIRRSEEKPLSLKVDSRGMIDLTQINNEGRRNDLNSTSSNVNNGNTNPFNFLDNLANSSSSNNLSSDFLAPNPKTNESDAEIISLKIKIDDLEYKLAQLVDKLIIIESKLSSFENKF